MTEILQPLTPHFSARRPSMIILHGTAVDSDHSMQILTGITDRQASAHYLIDRDGTLTQFLDDSLRAWHAGASYWAGLRDVNSLSIGIEMVCLANDDIGWSQSFYTDEQHDVAADLVKKLIGQYQIDPHSILGHQDISPYIKTDPGPHFDWVKFAKQGLGLWHDLIETKNDAVVADQNQINQFKNSLALFGYDNRPSPEGRDYSDVVRAFQTHFLPWNICGQVTEQSIKAIEILLKKKFGL